MEHTQALEHLGRMVQVPTDSTSGKAEFYQMERFHLLLEELYPELFRRAEVRPVGQALLLELTGGGGGRAPILFVAHMDVVEAKGDWTYPPYSGAVADGCIWGRGTLDMKGALCALLEALEQALKQGTVFDRTVYVFLCCDEETGGETTKRAVELLQERGVRLEMVYDEGGTLADRFLDLGERTIAVLGVAEKGSAVLRFTARGEAGRAASPPKNSPIARLADFVHYCEHHRVLKRRLTPEIRDMYRGTARYAGGLRGLVYRSGPLMKLLGPLLLPPHMRGNTLAFTQQEGSGAPNVLPREASVTGFLRLGPTESLEESLTRLRAVADRFGLETEVVKVSPAAPTSDYHCPGIQRARRSLERALPGMPAVPFVLDAGTDSRHFVPIAQNILRFSPIYMDLVQGKGVHGVNEYMNVDVLDGAISYYEYLLKEYELK